jgi:hypothetical protein
LAFVLIVSFALRFIIAVRGGQYFWTDESAFVLSQRAATAFLTGQFREGADELFSHSAHMLFEVVGVIPAMAQIKLGGVVWLPAVFFGSFSVGIIYLTSRLVRALGGSSREGLFAAFLMASCTSFLYYARHVFPYDLALFLCLWGALCGFRSGRMASLSAGVLSGLGFLTYNAYWWFGGTILILTVLGRREPLLRRVERAATSLVGLILPIVAVLGIAWLLGHPLIGQFAHHAYLVSADTGDRGIAWRVMPQYLWVSERYLFCFLAIAFLAALGLWVAGKLDGRVKLWLTGSVLFYVGQLVVFDVLRLFFVCARHARPLAIFLCLIGGWFMAKLASMGRPGRSATALLAAAILVQTAVNFSVPLRQVFPPEFETRAEAAIADDMDHDPWLYRILGGGYGESEDDAAVRRRPNIILYRRPHPLEFIPYTFDDYTEVMRTAYHKRDISMQAVRLLPENPDGRPQIERGKGPWAPFPGGVRLELIFDPGVTGIAQPIVGGGRTGAGDQVFVQFVDAHRIRFGVDHWGAGASYSSTISCDYALPHVLMISIGSLYPDESFSSFRENPTWKVLRHFDLITFDGVPILSKAMDCHSASARSVAFFHNLIGFSTSAPDFRGRVISASPVGAPEILRAIAKAGKNEQGGISKSAKQTGAVGSGAPVPDP